MKTQAVLFDFDYTLGDSTPGIYNCACYALKKMGHPMPDYNAVRHTIGLSLPRSYTALTGDERAENGERYTRLFRETAASNGYMLDHTTLFPETIPTLSRLYERGIPLGIVTTKRKETIREILEKFGISHLISVIIGVDDAKAPKPDPSGLLMALKALTVSAENALYVGDTVVDARTATKEELGLLMTALPSQEEEKA